MSRVSYQQHLAQKRAREFARTASGSVTGSQFESVSETDFSSLGVSSTTHPSYSHSYSYSYSNEGSHPSSSEYNTQQQRRRQEYPRSFSGASQGSLLSTSSYSPSIHQPHGNAYRPGYGYGESSRSSFSAFPPSSSPPPASGILGIGIDGTREYLAPPKDQRKADRAHCRRERERERMATERDPPLRRWLRSMSGRGLGEQSLIVGLVAAGAFQLAIQASTKKDENWSVDWWEISAQMMCWAMIRLWVITEGNKRGRSWRTQVLGILTIVLSPTFIFASASLLVSCIIGTIMLLNSGNDRIAILLFSISTLLPHGRLTFIAYAPAILGYIAGKGIWIGGGFKGGIYFLETLAAFAPAFGLPTLCRVNKDEEKYVEQLLRWIPASSQITLQRVYDLVKQVADHLPKKNQLPPLQHICASETSWRESFGSNSKITTLLGVLGALPPMLTMVHSSLVLRPSTASMANGQQSQSQSQSKNTTPTPSTVPPIISLLPLAMFITSIPTFLLSSHIQIHTPENVILPLIPISLLMALPEPGRGRKDGTWNMSIWLHIIGTMSLVPLSSGWREVAGSSVVMVLWTTLIGFTPYALIPTILRQLIHSFLPQKILEKYALSIENIIVRSTFVMAWIWAMRKLLETTWAMGGLGLGLRNKNEQKDKDRDKEKKVA